MAVVVVSVDEFGRVVVPKRVREAFSTTKFALQMQDGEIRLTPLMGWGGLFGSIPELSTKMLDKLRKEDAEYG